MKLEEALIRLDEEELFGKVHSVDILYRNTEENKEFVDKISKLEEPFYESLNDNQKKEFEELIELHALNGAVTDKRIFIFAFSLAIKLILENKI